MVPDLLKKASDSESDEIQLASSEELARLVSDNADPLDYGKIPTVEQVLSSTSVLESINVDEEAYIVFLLLNGIAIIRLCS